MGSLLRAGARICEKATSCTRPRYFVAPSVTFSLEILADEKAPIMAIMIILPLPILIFRTGLFWCLTAALVHIHIDFLCLTNGVTFLTCLHMIVTDRSRTTHL